MIVCHGFRFIFLRLPKTASTSVEIALSRFCGSEDVITEISLPDEAIRRELGYPGPQNHLRPWHAYPLHEWRRMLVRRRRPDYRHPSAGAVCRFVGKAAWNAYYKFCIERNPFDRAISWYYFDARNKVLPDINEYVCSLGREKISNWRRYTVNDRIAVDHVGRYEDLGTELTAVSERLGLQGLVLPSVRTKGGYRRDRRHFSQVLNNAARRHIEAMCAREIEMFSYGWTDTESQTVEPPAVDSVNVDAGSPRGGGIA